MKNLNELLPIGEKNGQKAVNARDLHSFLQVGKDFSTWIKNRIDKYDFIEGKDFQTLYLDYQGNLLNIRLPPKMGTLKINKLARLNMPSQSVWQKNFR